MAVVGCKKKRWMELSYGYVLMVSYMQNVCESYVSVLLECEE